MHTILSLVLTIIYHLNSKTLAQSNEDIYCPSEDWIYLGKEGDHCYLEGDIKSTTISFGANNNKVGSFVFWDLTNTQSNTFELTCEDGAFGDPFSGITKG